MVCLTRGTVQGASSVSSAPQFAMILSSGSLQDLALLFWCQREVKQPGFNICSLYNSLYSFKRFPWLIQSGDRTTLAKVLLVQTCTSVYKTTIYQSSIHPKYTHHPGRRSVQVGDLEGDTRACKRLHAQHSGRIAICKTSTISHKF